MSPRDPGLSFAPDGAALASGDGPELLAWRADGAPTWKVFTEGRLVAVVVGLEHVISVDSDGRLCRWQRGDGEPAGTERIQGEILGLALAPDGREVAVITRAGPVISGPQGSRLIPIPDTTAAGFGPAGAIGVGRADGTFAAVELRTGATWGEVKLGAAVAGVAWSALGSWVVGCERVLFRISGDGKTLQAAMPGADKAIAAVTCSRNGLVAAAAAGDHVEVWELHKNRPLGEFVLRRALTGVAFGPELLLAVGLDDGDGTWVNLADGSTFRTEPHQGRSRTTWRLENRVDLAAVRGAITLHQAGAAPVARYVPRPDPHASSASSGWVAGCVSTFGVVFVLSAMCGGLMLLMYVLKTYDLWRYLPLR